MFSKAEGGKTIGCAVVVLNYDLKKITGYG